MKYVKQLLQDREYLACVKRLEQLEADREFCRHGLSHFLDVARIGWILILEHAVKDGMEFQSFLEQKEQIYLTALLHDIGRLAQLEDGTPHESAGKEMAGRFLRKIDYPISKQPDILEAIQDHRGTRKTNGDLATIIKEADNRSRNCFFCEALEKCNWEEERRNLSVWY